ncbi:hypothetical protein GLOIN_2v1784920 [Rhizophagus clarus]|uniref:Ion transport domain-containing protein n=1 Tax=Rhizophagus clarus TaxID=94130 RepID=A0A8H3R169_9GLOM|nr:hypothetical protein GLOIN_2v1784920 [Rhizophagus clarus]
MGEIVEIDIPDNIKEHGEEIEKISKDGIRKISEEHRKSICRIFVSQYMDDTTYKYEYGSDDYVVTYSEEDESIDKINDLDELSFILNKKILSLNNRRLIDLNSDRTSSNDRFLELKHPVFGYDYGSSIGHDAIGFLPYGDLIQVSLGYRKIYKYCLTDKPKETVPWKYSQINDIEIPKSYYHKIDKLTCSICRIKLFLIVAFESSSKKLLQFDLLTMNLERQYTLETDVFYYFSRPVIMNKNQTLLATEYGGVCIFSMENGMLIFKHKCGIYEKSTITLKNNSERLVIISGKNSKLIDLYQVYDEIDISDDFNYTSVITKLNRKIYIDNDHNVCITGRLYDHNLQQLSNELIYLNSIYSSSTIFKIIQNMLIEIIDQKDIRKAVSSNNVKIISSSAEDIVEMESFGCIVPHILSFKLLNNQDLVLIHMEGITIFTINENECRYFWNNKEWKDIYEKFTKDYDRKYDINFTNEYYKSLIGRILKNEFGDSKHSIPCPKSEVIEVILNDNLVSSKYGSEMLKAAIKKKSNDIVRQIIETIQDYSESYMAIISLYLSELCDNYPDYIIKYISRTSILLLPYYARIGNSRNTSLHSYTKDIYIKESNIDNIIFKFISRIYKELIRPLRIKEEIQTVNFIVPFPQICVYKDDNHEIDHDDDESKNKKNHDIKSKIITILILILKKMITGLKIIMMIPKRNSIWNEFLYKPKSILFCNIDSNHFYNWWNFAAIIDFKWKTFGRNCYYLIWLFYTIFYICYSLASTLEQKSFPDFYFKLLFIISIILGSIFLIFEIRQFLWNYKRYFKDIWNLFVLGYAQAFFIVLRSNNFNDDNDPRNLATKYDLINPDGTINNTTSIIQDPDSNTNLFNWFPTSLLAVYKLITGDSGSLSPFT